MTNEIETTWTARLLKTDIPHIVRGVVYEPCTTGHSCQLDTQQDWITPDELRKAAWNFMKTSLLKKGHTIGNQHKGEVEAIPVESYVTPADMEVDGELWKAGSWVVSVEVSDAATWADVESGKLNAFSIGGTGVRIQADPHSSSE